MEPTRDSRAIHAETIKPAPELETLGFVDKKLRPAKVVRYMSEDSGSPRSTTFLHLEGRTVSDICQGNPDVPAVWIGKLAKLLAIKDPTTNPNALPLDLVASRKQSSRQCGCHYCRVMWLSMKDGASCKASPPGCYPYHNVEAGENFHTQIPQPSGYQMHSEYVPKSPFDIVLTAMQNLIGQKRKFHGHAITDTADIFKGMDKDGSGTIDHAEFKGGVSHGLCRAI